MFQQSPKLAGEDRSFGPEGLLVCISVHLLVLVVTQGRVHFIGLVFYIMVLRVPLLLSRRALSHWTLRDHQLYRKMFLLL
jgi:hypothetical protein